MTTIMLSVTMEPGISEGDAADLLTRRIAGLLEVHSVGVVSLDDPTQHEVTCPMGCGEIFAVTHDEDGWVLPSSCGNGHLAGGWGVRFGEPSVDAMLAELGAVGQPWRFA